MAMEFAESCSHDQCDTTLDLNDHSAVLSALTCEQAFDGSFRFSKTVIEALGVEKCKLPSGEETLWATATVCLWLKEKMGDMQEERRLIEEKTARIVDSLLNGRSKEDVEKHARDLLGF